MKTITERDGKNVNMQVVGDLHQYADGSVHTVKDGKATWERGGGGSGGGVVDIEAISDPNGNSVTVNMASDDFINALLKGARVYALISQREGILRIYLYFSTMLTNNSETIVRMVPLGLNVVFEGIVSDEKTIFRVTNT